jgi:hypothetical protein
VSVALFPGQIGVVEAEFDTDNTGIPGKTVTVITAVDKHPRLFVP